MSGLSNLDPGLKFFSNLGLTTSLMATNVNKCLKNKISLVKINLCVGSSCSVCGPSFSVLWWCHFTAGRILPYNFSCSSSHSSS